VTALAGRTKYQAAWFFVEQSAQSTCFVSDCLSYSQSLPSIGFDHDLCLVMKCVYMR